jgi:hypothetical protein
MMDQAVLIQERPFRPILRWHTPVVDGVTQMKSSRLRYAAATLGAVGRKLLLLRVMDVVMNMQMCCQ